MSKETFELVKKLYKTESGAPFEMSEGECELFDIIFKRIYPRVHIMTLTQYGKSSTISKAVLTRATTFPEKFTIIGANKKKAQIIGGMCISSIFDNPYTLKRFEIGPDESLERIKRERSKDRLTFRLEDKKMGEIQILSAEAHRLKDFEKALIGFGAPNVILDDAALIPDEIFDTVLRMVGGHKNSMLVKIGNPLKRNHFLRSFRSERYYKLVIKYEQAIKEGRVTKEFIEEAREEMDPIMFKILYECEFPPEDMIDKSGYMALITEKEIDMAYRPSIELFGEIRMGIDVAGGGRNKSIILLRGENGAKKTYESYTSDTMSLVGEALKQIKEIKIKPQNVFIDTIGVGKGAGDRLKEQIGEINEVVSGSTPENEEADFINLKAQMSWRAAKWIKTGGQLEGKGEFDDALDIKYKIQSDKKIKIKSKEEMLKEGILSPDTWDSLCLTFAREAKIEQRPGYKQKDWESSSDYQGK